MSKKATLTSLHKDLNAADGPSPAVEEKIHTEDRNPATSKPIDSDIPRGQRGDFQKLTITMPGNMMVKLKTIGAKRKAAGAKNCDTSALIRESLAEWLAKQV